MAGTETLTPEAPAGTTAREACPRCDEPWGAIPAVSTSLLAEPLRRCRRCGARFTCGAPPWRTLLTCDRCSLPFLPDARQAEPAGPARPGREEDPRCPACASGESATAILDPSLTRATEIELRLALERQWRFVGNEALTSYLGSIVRRVAARIDGAPRECAVQLVDDADVCTLALPSGTVLMSVGMLQALEDEAELAFVLGHELAHAASADAAVRLVRRGLRAVADEHDAAPGREAWGRAAEELVELGYGRRRERAADEKSMDVLLRLDYDPLSVGRYLERLHRRIEEGDPRVRAHALAHPPPRDRRRRLDSQLAAAARPAAAVRVNREVFRRAAGSAALERTLSPVGSIGGKVAAPQNAPAPPRTPVGLWVGLGAAALLILATVLALLLG